MGVHEQTENDIEFRRYLHVFSSGKARINTETIGIIAHKTARIIAYTNRLCITVHLELTAYFIQI